MHIPVLVSEVVEYLNPKRNENFIDATLGGAGHTKAILDHNAPAGKVLGIDLDEDVIRDTRYEIRNTKRLLLVHGNFADIKEIAKENKFHPVHGILFDLGFSSDQLEQRKRGFSFQKDEPLDMRYDTNNPFDAEKIVNYSSKAEIEVILKEFGEEQFAKEIAREIIETRSIKPITTTKQLVNAVQKATPRWYHKRKIHPATKTFQALRISTNNELENLKQGLKAAVKIVQDQGRIVVISFHSFEDRIVKKFFNETKGLTIRTKKPITPSQKEIQINPRSRSAKLRAVTLVRPNGSRIKQ
ncbi:16S rRNA (cytosine(1402)-N(4))-methyltransferase RsmH [Patescibacteria group bacterium]|nr:16S rRNA (cytosine(1402)-N(4))-methyltransferase RsmH [Patescibacteria group bacterium]